MKRIFFGLLISLCLPAVAKADNYIGLNYLETRYDERGFDTSKPTAWALRFGSALSENVAIEARLGSGASSDRLEIDPTTHASLEIKQLFGVYARLMAPLGERVTVYGLAGITRVKLEASARIHGVGVKVSESETDLSIGVGVDLMLTTNGFINLEYALLQSDEDAYDLDALSIGVGLRF